MRLCAWPIAYGMGRNGLEWTIPKNGPSKSNFSHTGLPPSVAAALRRLPQGTCAHASRGHPISPFACVLHGSTISFPE